MNETEEIIKNIDDDIIKRASYLLFTLIQKESIDSAIEKTKNYLKKQGWLLKEDKEFLDKIHMKSFRDINKWIDYNMKKI